MKQLGPGGKLWLSLARAGAGAAVEDVSCRVGISKGKQT